MLSRNEKLYLSRRVCALCDQRLDRNSCGAIWPPRCTPEQRKLGSRLRSRSIIHVGSVARIAGTTGLIRPQGSVLAAKPTGSIRRDGALGDVTDLAETQ